MIYINNYYQYIYMYIYIYIYRYIYINTIVHCVELTDQHIYDRFARKLTDIQWAIG